MAGVKMYRYQVTEVSGPAKRKSAKVGDVLLYKSGRGPRHAEAIFNTKGRIQEVWKMVAIGPCWVVDGKIVSVKDYPKKDKQDAAAGEELAKRCRPRQ
jgi:hypothetical protein